MASELEPVTTDLFVWRAYDPNVKADLYSAGITTGAGTFLIDPIELAPSALADLRMRSPIAGIIVTNENHERAAGRFADEFEVPIHLHETLARTTTLARAETIHDRSLAAPGLTAVAIDGGPAGEIALHSQALAGTLIIGDALINFEPYGFTFLPKKYCSNANAMRRSLAPLLDLAFERILFAHGTPILTGARHRLERLLGQR
jgi:hypothetical protein